MGTVLRHGLRRKPSITEVALAAQQAEDATQRDGALSGPNGRVVRTRSLAETRAAYNAGACVLVDLTEVEGRRQHRGVFDDAEPTERHRRRRHRKTNVARVMRQVEATAIKREFGR